jgi:uncharacterized repeat protein (TIGR03803 family)
LLTTLPGAAQVTLYNFKSYAGAVAPLIRDSADNLYGTTYVGSNNNGTVFEVNSPGHESILHTFTGSPDGSQPWGGAWSATWRVISTVPEWHLSATF